MLNPTVTRRWTVATWLTAGIDDAAAIAGSLDEFGCDAIALQSVRRAVVERVADALGMRHEWVLSHYPQTPLFKHQGVGLAVLTPHQVTEHRHVVVSSSSSTWSRSRRVAQYALVQRPDASAYAIVHAVGPLDDVSTFAGAAPRIVVRPVQVGIDVAAAVRLPDQAKLVSSATTTPLPEHQALLRVTFDHDWVQADFPTA